MGEDIVIVKHRVSAFTGTDLEMILRAKEIDTLVMFGVATSGVVLSTLLTAADDDYRIIVLRDLCADQDDEVHAALLDRNILCGTSGDPHSSHFSPVTISIRLMLSMLLPASLSSSSKWS